MPQELLIQDEIIFVLSSGRQKRFLIKFMYDVILKCYSKYISMQCQSYAEKEKLWQNVFLWRSSCEGGNVIDMAVIKVHYKARLREEKDQFGLLSTPSYHTGLLHAC